MTENEKTTDNDKKSFTLSELKAALSELILEEKRKNNTSKPKYYAVARGYNPGIYMYWEGEGGAQEQVDGFKNNKHQRFSTRVEAEIFIETHKVK